MNNIDLNHIEVVCSLSTSIIIIISIATIMVA